MKRNKENFSKYSFYQLRKKQDSRRQGNLGPSRLDYMKTVARILGMKFSPIEESSSRPLLNEFELFNKGRNRQILNVIENTTDLMETKLKIFDYKFEFGYSSSRRNYYQTVFFIQSKKLGLPMFSMEPESMFDKLASYLGMQQDINFVQYPKFSSQYLLRGEDEQYIRYMMNEELLHFFSHNTGWHMEGVNYYLILYRLNHLVSPDLIKSFYERGMVIYKSLVEQMKWELN